MTTKTASLLDDARQPRASEPLWAITCYFNPAGYRNRLRNYRIFRRHLAVPLVTVELCYGPHGELQSADADVLIQVHGGDVLWQKERLLGIGLQRVPALCPYVAWLDCDVVFERADWAASACGALERFPIIQLFKERCNLAPDAAAGNDLDTNRQASRVPSMGSQIVHRRFTTDDLQVPGASTTGIAWAARAHVLRDQGLYDACILGSGDRALVCAALGKHALAVEGLQMTGQQADHYARWARPFREAIHGCVGYVDGRIFHLWHGDLADRRYVGRFQGFRVFDFDPSLDIAKNEHQIWRWSSHKPEMHEYVRRYFDLRQEDGRIGAGSAADLASRDPAGLAEAKPSAPE